MIEKAQKLLKELRSTDDTDHKLELISIALQISYDEGFDVGYDEGRVDKQTGDCWGHL